MTNCDVINIRNIITSEGTKYWIREIKRSPDTMKAAAILVCIYYGLLKIYKDVSELYEYVSKKIQSQYCDNDFKDTVPLASNK